MSDTDKQAINHLREVLRHRLLAWDESIKAENLLGQEVDTQSKELDYYLAGIDDPDSVYQIADAEVLEMFGLDVESCK
jgi:hypothetical protein